MNSTNSAPANSPQRPAHTNLQVQPYLRFDGTCDEAIAFYRSAVGAEVVMRMPFKDCPDRAACPPDSDDKVMHAALRIGASTVLMSDGRCERRAKFDGFCLSLTAPGVREAEELFSKLAVGGEVTMPLASTFFSERFGMLTDRFGVAWMVYVALPEGSAA